MVVIYASGMYENKIIGTGTEHPEQLLANPNNWRIHPKGQQDALESLLDDVGWVQNIIVNQRTGHVVDGHMRAAVAISRNETEVPVVYVDLTDDEERKVLASLDPIGAMAVTDKDVLSDLISDLTMTDVLDELVRSVAAEDPLQAVKDSLKGKSSFEALSPIDMITTAGIGSCCVAVQLGFQFGIRSTGRFKNADGAEDKPVCGNMQRFSGRHKIIFVDNEFSEYNHEKHINDVKHIKPKYATVRDLMTQQQCDEAEIKYYSIEQILQQAEEIDQYAENTIVIPKYDCLDDIPEKFMLGYSIPASYGGTPLPIDLFKGRRIHLLGGSWEQQLKAIEILGSDVVSADMNNFQKLALFGLVTYGDGTTKKLRELFASIDGLPEGEPHVSPRLACYILSAGAIMAGAKKLGLQDNEQYEEDWNE